MALVCNGTPDTGILARSVTSVNQVFSTARWACGANGPLASWRSAYSRLKLRTPTLVPATSLSKAIPGTPGAAPTYWIDSNGGRPSRSLQWSIGVQREIDRNLTVEASYVGNHGAWWPVSTVGANYNANTPQSLLADGLDITTLAARNILAAPIGSPAAGPFQNKPPYPNFPLTATVAQSLRPFPQAHELAHRRVGPVGR